MLSSGFAPSAWVQRLGYRPGTQDLSLHTTGPARLPAAPYFSHHLPHNYGTDGRTPAAIADELNDSGRTDPAKFRSLYSGVRQQELHLTGDHVRQKGTKNSQSDRHNGHGPAFTGHGISGHQHRPSEPTHDSGEGHQHRNTIAANEGSLSAGEGYGSGLQARPQHSSDAAGIPAGPAKPRFKIDPVHTSTQPLRPSQRDPSSLSGGDPSSHGRRPVALYQGRSVPPPQRHLAEQRPPLSPPDQQPRPPAASLASHAAGNFVVLRGGTFSDIGETPGELQQQPPPPAPLGFENFRDFAEFAAGSQPVLQLSDPAEERPVTRLAQVQQPTEPMLALY